PLPHWHPRQHRVNQMGGPLRHPPAPTARTPPAPFTPETAPRRPRTQELSELTLDELQQPTPSPASAAACRKVSRCSPITGGARYARRLAGDTRVPYTPCPAVARTSRRAHAQRSTRPPILIPCSVRWLVERLPR